MKKALKIVLITIASLLLVLIVAVSIALWFVFTPEKLTPIVRKEAAKYITCPVEIGEVELTFFSTFPKFGMKVSHLALVNPVKDAPNDTLLSASQLVGIIDVNAWMKRNEVKVEELIFSKGCVNIFYDSLGKDNFDIVAPMPEGETDTTSLVAGLENVRFENVDFSYVDHSLATNVYMNNLTGTLNGTYRSGTLSSKIVVDQSLISLDYDKEKYLDRVSTRLNLLSDITIYPLKMVIKEANGTLNNFPIEASGSFEEDTVTENLSFNLTFNVASSPVEGLLKMVPPSYQSYFKGIDANGFLSADGSMIGVYSNTTMPMFDIHLTMENGTAKYEGVPLLLSDINGEVTIRTDGMTDSLTNVRIEWLKAKTPKSSFSMKGYIDHLFSDVCCNLDADADLTLDEFNAMIPASMKATVAGKAKGPVKCAFSMTQFEKMQIDKMKFSGDVALSGFNATYDSLSFKTDNSRVKFDLPNPKAVSKSTKFMNLDITAQRLSAGKLKSYSANLAGTHLLIESSNVMDTTRIPDLTCSFVADSLSGGMDTLNLAVKKAMGKVEVSPRDGHPDQPKIKLTGHTQNILACMGKDSVTMKKFDVTTKILNQKEQKDIFLQWFTNGTIGLEQGRVVMTGIDPVEIPAIKFDFSPEKMRIWDSRLKIGQSDFGLKGNLSNLLSYYRKDSILRGDLNFTSNNTDVLGLMTMTSGIGYADEKADTVGSSGSTGPYMVPKGIDVSLHADVKKATLGTDVASDINGDLRIYDGILLLDELKLTTPAARMQLTAMYRTPRKNHLFLGLDFHMLDIEIEQLLKMVPDIDSIMPMLKSFRGKGEFHIAAETYLDSLYRLKMSTLRGAASIKGQNLVLMDGQTFTEIAKTLKFNKKTENRVDSLSAEFTVFKNEIDIYPFLIVMDKYKAVVAGRHNLDMSFDYHISVVDCPLPIKLGVDVKGTMDHLSYKLVPCKYAELYRPSSRKVVENKQLELRKMIREALINKVKDN